MQQMLAIPAANAEVERLFSASTSIITPFRAHLDEETSKQLVFLKVNCVNKKYNKTKNLP